jgi:hypothetical protein
MFFKHYQSLLLLFEITVAIGWIPWRKKDIKSMLKHPFINYRWIRWQWYKIRITIFPKFRNFFSKSQTRHLVFFSTFLFLVMLPWSTKNQKFNAFSILTVTTIVNHISTPQEVFSSGKNIK